MMILSRNALPITGTARCPIPSHGLRSRTASHSRKIVVQSAPTSSVSTEVEDKFIARNFGHLRGSNQQPTLGGLHESSWDAIASMRMPSTRNESYRFTDITPLLKTTLTAAGERGYTKQHILDFVPEAAAQSYVALVDGVVRQDLSDLSAVQGVRGSYVGNLAAAPAEAVGRIGALTSARGGPFALLNGGLASDTLVVHLPAEVMLEPPIYILHMTSEGGAEGAVSSAPRVLVSAGEGASVTVMEEFVGGDANSAASMQMRSMDTDAAQHPYLNNNVTEVFLAPRAQMVHGCVFRDVPGAFNFKSTLVAQEEESSYTLTESRTGGGLTRHDVGICQEGPRTETDMRHFVLAGASQLHDLHTRLTLNHPEGKADQLHKCIVSSSSGRGVFDGNVQVQQKAQQTDAGQLSRNLLLAPRATVNVKPNLQIVADDVTCTHGCAVSDLSEEELFYFRARGINAIAARQALVASFGAEVTQRLRLKEVMARVQRDVAGMLAAVDLVALNGAK